MFVTLFTLILLCLYIYGRYIFKKYVSCGHKQLYALKVFNNGRSSLKYQGSIPILILNEVNEYQNGFVHGYYLAEYIQQLSANCMRIMRWKLNPKICSNIFNNLQYPHQLELIGLVDGYNHWAHKTQNPQKQLYEIVFLHLLPDLSNEEQSTSLIWSLLKLFGKLTGNLPIFGCTTLVVNSNDGLIMGRNLDWCPFGLSGTYSLIIHWKKIGITSLTLPGLIGIATGWKRDCVLAMNSCPNSSSLQNIQACALFNNREILENPKLLETHLLPETPSLNLIPYNLIYCSPLKTQHVCYNIDRSPYVRDLKDHNPLIALNYNYPTCLLSSLNSTGRLQYLNKNLPVDEESVFKSLQVKELTNSWLTLHSCVFNLTKGQFHLSMDNGYAASGQYQALKWPF